MDELSTQAVTQSDSNTTLPPQSSALSFADDTTGSPVRADNVAPTHSSDSRRHVTLIDPRHEASEEEEEEDTNLLIDRALGVRPTTPQRESVIRDISKLRQQSRVQALRKRFSLLAKAVEGTDPKILELHEQIAKFDQITRNREERTRKQQTEQISQQHTAETKPSCSPAGHSGRKSPRSGASNATSRKTVVVHGNSNHSKSTQESTTKNGTINPRNSARLTRSRGVSATVTADFRREFQRRHTLAPEDKYPGKTLNDDDDENDDDDNDVVKVNTESHRARSLSDVSSQPPVIAAATSNVDDKTSTEKSGPPIGEIDDQISGKEETSDSVPQQTTSDSSEEHQGQHVEPQDTSGSASSANQDTSLVTTDNEPQKMDDSTPEQPSMDTEPDRGRFDSDDTLTPSGAVSAEKEAPNDEAQTPAPVVPVESPPSVEVSPRDESEEHIQTEEENIPTNMPHETEPATFDNENAIDEEEHGEEPDILISSDSGEVLSHQGSIPVIHIGSLGDLTDEASTPLSARSQDEDSDGARSTHSNSVSEPSKYTERTPRWYTRVGKGLTLRAPRFLKRRKVSLENILQSSSTEKNAQPTRSSKRFSTRDYAIHIKELETEDPSELKTGWLHKKHGIFKSWRELYFVLKKDTIKYFKDQHQKRLAGIIRLDEAVVTECPRKTHFSEYCFSIARRGKEIFVYTRSREDYFDWLLSIRDVIRFLQEELAE